MSSIDLSLNLFACDMLQNFSLNWKLEGVSNADIYAFIGNRNVLKVQIAHNIQKYLYKISKVKYVL